MQVVTIFECDLCASRTSLFSSEDWALFTSTWYDGLKKHFCPECLDSADALETARSDKDLKKGFLVQVGTAGREELDLIG